VFQQVLERRKEVSRIELRHEEFTVAQMIAALRAQILASADNSVNLIQFFEACPSRHAMIVAFLAVLEMVKLQAVALVQEKQFGDILVRKHKMFDLVFDESGGFKQIDEEYTKRRSRQGCRRYKKNHMTNEERKAALEAIIYAADEPATIEQLAKALGEEKLMVQASLDELVASYAAEERGIEVRAVAGGYKLYTKPQQHDVVRRFIKSLRPPLRLSMPALETLAVIAYKQPVTSPEISEIRGVNT